MKINIDKLLAYSIVITADLPFYRQRDIKFYNNFTQHNLFPLPKKFFGFALNNGIYRKCGLIKTSNICNVFLSHIAVIKMAQALNYPFICIFENDAFPCIDCKKHLQTMLNVLPNDVDAVKLGHLGIIKTVSTNDNSLFQTSESYGAHAYIVFKKYYDEYINSCQQDFRVDHQALNPHGNFQIFTVKKMLFAQADNGGVSNNASWIKLVTSQGYMEGFNYESRNCGSDKR